MKIAVCARKFTPPYVGGVDVYADRLSRALVRLGHEVTVLACDSSLDREDDAITISSTSQEGLKVWRIEFAFDKRPPVTFQTAYDPEMGQAIKKVLADEKPDLFIIMNFYTITLAAVEAAADLDIPIAHIATDFIPICRRATFIRWDGTTCQVGESRKNCAACFVSQQLPGRMAASFLDRFPENQLVHVARTWETRGDLNPIRWLKPYWKQMAIMDDRLRIVGPLREKIDAVFTPNRFTQKLFLENGFSSEQVHLLPFSVESNNPLAKLERTPAPHLRFLFIGRLQPYKGAHLLIDAFNRLVSPSDAELTVYGTPDGYDTYFDNLLKEMNKNSRIHYAGRIAPTDLGRAFANSDFFLLPSTWHENSPLIILDALQSRTPIIASDIGGITDLVQDGLNGLLFRRGDTLSLQNVLQKVIDQPDLAHQLQAGEDLPLIEDYAEQLVFRVNESRNPEPLGDMQ